MLHGICRDGCFGYDLLNFIKKTYFCDFYTVGSVSFCLFHLNILSCFKKPGYNLLLTYIF